MHAEVEVDGLLRSVLGFGVEDGGRSLLLKWGVLRDLGGEEAGLLFKGPKLPRRTIRSLEDSHGFSSICYMYSSIKRRPTSLCSSLTVLNTEGLIVGSCIRSGRDDVAESKGFTLGRKR